VASNNITSILNFIQIHTADLELHHTEGLIDMAIPIRVQRTNKKYFFIRIVGGGVHTGSTRHVGHYLPRVTVMMMMMMENFVE
jgi:hypothetical protein